MRHPPCQCDSPTSECPRYGWMKGRKYEICRGTALPEDKRDVLLELWANRASEKQIYPRQGHRTEPISAVRKLPEGTTILPAPVNVERDGVGLELKNLLGGLGLKESTGCGCNDLARHMNVMGIEWCRSHREELVDKLRKAAKKTKLKDRLRAALKAVSQGLAFHLNPLDPIPGLLDEAIRRAGAKLTTVVPGVTNGDVNVGKKLKWAYGVTTVLARRDTLLPKTLTSLVYAGFPNPHLFVDGDANVMEWKSRFPNSRMTFHDSPLKTHGNWLTGMLELYIREPWADRYAMFQDDMVTYHNLRAYLEAIPYPEKGYLNLYTFPSNYDLAPKEEGKVKTGFYLSNQFGRGAVALAFDLETVKALLSHKNMIDRAQDAHRGHRAVDGGIVTALAELGIKEYVHAPSLVQHTGLVSSMGSKSHPLANSFRGDDFDALSLLAVAVLSESQSSVAEPGYSEPLGSVINDAVEEGTSLPSSLPDAYGASGEPLERTLGEKLDSTPLSRALDLAEVNARIVEEWLGDACCVDRQDKEVALEAWVKQTLKSGEQSREYLYSIMGIKYPSEGKVGNPTL